ncbi:hypothetical protein BGX28_008032 [Mortierella sp. GBA30]|nr:hypothetical protein BGX28_008032 [Mortierella sp. GBA30]
MRFLTAPSTAALAFVTTALTVQAAPLANDDSTHIDDHQGMLMKRDTPGWNDFNCKSTTARPNPLVLLHGLGSQGEQHWSVFAPKFAAKGYCVFTPTYGSMPGQTLVNGLDSVENSGKQLSEYIDKVLASTGASKVNILGHSEGSSLANYYLLKMDGASKVDRAAYIGSNLYGTSFLAMSTLAKTLGLFDGAQSTFSPLCKACFELLEGSKFLKDLNAKGDTVSGVKYISIVTKTEEFVTPKENGFFKDQNINVRNVYLQDLCATDLSEHIALMASSVVFNAVSAHFDNASVENVGCSLPFIE